MTEEISIAVAGDFCPTEHVERAVSQLQRPADMLGACRATVPEADLAIANLEYPLTTSETKLIKYGSHQKGHPATVSVLKQAGIGLLTLANNHMLDYGKAGLIETLETCARANIAVVGAGRTLEEARSHTTSPSKDGELRCWASARTSFPWPAKDAPALTVWILSPITHSIQEARRNAEIVIVLVHGGTSLRIIPVPGWCACTDSWPTLGLRWWLAITRITCRDRRSITGRRSFIA